MARRSRHAISYAPEISRQADAILPGHHGEIRRAIEEQLSFTPGSATRNRKPLEYQPGPHGATWELRCGARNQFRVFYEFNPQISGAPFQGPFAHPGRPRNWTCPVLEGSVRRGGSASSRIRRRARGALKRKTIRIGAG
jgi:hypothetical protein